MSEIEKAINVLHDCEDSASGTPFAAVYHMAADALREKQEREKGCEWCHGKAFDNVGLSTAFGEKKVVLHGGWGEVDAEERFKICPRCGRDLRKLVP